MSPSKDFTLFNTVVGPNGWYVLHSVALALAILIGLLYRKVAMVLSELDLTYEEIFLDTFKGETKLPQYTKYNPNGRVPALIDHRNHDFVIWCVRGL